MSCRKWVGGSQNHPASPCPHRMETRTRCRRALLNFAVFEPSVEGSLDEYRLLTIFTASLAVARKKLNDRINSYVLEMMSRLNESASAADVL